MRRKLMQLIQNRLLPRTKSRHVLFFPVFTANARLFSSGSDQHAFFQQQLEELEKERTSLLGDEPPNIRSGDGDYLITKPKDHPPPPLEQYAMDMEDIHAERESLFQFSEEEKQAWRANQSSTSTSNNAHRLSSKLLQEIQEARAAGAATIEPKAATVVQFSPVATGTTSIQDAQHHESFSHLSPDGKSIHMVDVGHKQVTSRMARAQSKVILPPEVLEAFEWQQPQHSGAPSELVGPKGPIFTTAKIAGILAAKKTSDLIPLCHPLPLDQVQIEIRMSSPHEILIECTCRVTHKTGVEMEALVGASVAALTIYDMVKAVSHRVQITETKLVSKTGGKRTI